MALEDVIRDALAWDTPPVVLDISEVIAIAVRASEEWQAMAECAVALATIAASGEDHWAVKLARKSLSEAARVDAARGDK